ncbi:hypothetical protein HDV00_001661 [Rhizophlyctis rosea]|nr:hypothetical protein HDV00_001661 [Rhizophlyctis rosea]
MSISSEGGYAVLAEAVAKLYGGIPSPTRRPRTPSNDERKPVQQQQVSAPISKQSQNVRTKPDDEAKLVGKESQKRAETKRRHEKKPTPTDRHHRSHHHHHHHHHHHDRHKHSSKEDDGKSKKAHTTRERKKPLTSEGKRKRADMTSEASWTSGQKLERNTPARKDSDTDMEPEKSPSPLPPLKRQRKRTKTPSPEMDEIHSPRGRAGSIPTPLDTPSHTSRKRHRQASPSYLTANQDYSTNLRDMLEITAIHSNPFSPKGIDHYSPPAESPTRRAPTQREEMLIDHYSPPAESPKRRPPKQKPEMVIDHYSPPPKSTTLEASPQRHPVKEFHIAGRGGIHIAGRSHQRLFKKRRYEDGGGGEDEEEEDDETEANSPILLPGKSLYSDLLLSSSAGLRSDAGRRREGGILHRLGPQVQSVGSAAIPKSADLRLLLKAGQRQKNISHQRRTGPAGRQESHIGGVDRVESATVGSQATREEKMKRFAKFGPEAFRYVGGPAE